jgi:hypothetical protein
MIIGVAKFGLPTNRYDKDKLELRRFFVLDGTPKNTESWFLAQCERRLPSGTNLVTYVHHDERGSYLRSCNWSQVKGRPQKDYDSYIIGDKLYSKRAVWGWAKKCGLVDKFGSKTAKDLFIALAGGQKIIQPSKIKFIKKLVE